MVKFSCAFGANNQANQPIRFRRMSAHCIVATYKPILNIVKNFGRKLLEFLRNFFKCTPPLSPHLSEVRYGPAGCPKKKTEPAHT